jgi:hypothetical protein
VDEVPLLVTAAHVLDHHKRDGDLWIGAATTLVPLQGVFHPTVRPNGSRELDKFDFAVSLVPDSFLAELGNATIIESDFVSRGRRARGSGGLYVCLGYPNSKNKHPGGRELNVELFMHAGTGHTDPGRLGVLGSKYHGANFFIDLGEQVFDAKGLKKNPVSVRGMSGGPVFNIGDRGDYNTIRDDSDFKPLLEGIIIEKPEPGDTLVAVSIRAIVETARKNRLV